VQGVIPAAPGLIAVQPAVLVIAGVVVFHVAELLEVLQECEVSSIVVSQLTNSIPADVEPVILGPGQVKGAVEERALEEGILFEAAAVEACGIAEIGIDKIDLFIELYR